jgi:hypothetical protein
MGQRFHERASFVNHRHLVVSVVLVLLTAGCGVSQDQVDAITAERDALSSQLGVLQGELDTKTDQYAEAEGELDALVERVVELQENRDGWEDRAKAAEQSLETAENAAQERDTALAEAEKAKEDLADILLAYSDDIDAAMATISSTASSFACDWGTAQASDGKPLNSVTGEAVLRAFTVSDAFGALVDTPEIAAALNVAETLGDDRYGVAPDGVETIAVECWQKEDTKLNAALYEHQSVFREAALDAACTLGASEVFEGFSAGYWDTAVFQNWTLSLAFRIPWFRKHRWSIGDLTRTSKPTCAVSSGLRGSLRGVLRVV